MKCELHALSLQNMSVAQSLREAVEVIQSLSQLQAEIEAAGKLLRDTLLGGNKVLVCGNGGSAADGSHLASEIACRFVADRKPFPGLSLAADGSLLTAIGNDYSFGELFARQVRAYGSAGDTLVVLTTSGQSRNVLRALEQAGEQKMATIALLGRDGGLCRARATVELLVRHDVTARIQEAHKVIIHLLCEYLEPYLRDASPAG